MSSEKDINDTNVILGEHEDPAAQRARNRTVMLSPDVTGEVRARLAQDGQAPAFNFGRAPEKSAPNAPTGFTRAPQPSRPAVQAAREHLVNMAAVAQVNEIVEPPAPVARKAVMPSQPVVDSASGDYITWVKRTAVMGFLVSYDNSEEGEVYNLYAGRLIITSEPASSGSFLVINHETVSPMHAILRISASGEVQVLDQLSEHGTKIKQFGKEKLTELSGDKGTLEHGDTIIFGERKFHFCVVAKD